MSDRKYIDCREHPDSKSKCTLAISADSESEVIEATIQHVSAVHGMKDSPELRKQIKGMIREGVPV